MKKISKLLSLLAGAVSLMFFGCSDVDEENSVSSDVGSRSSNSKEYNVSFATPSGTTLSFDELGISSSSSARTIKGGFVGITDSSSGTSVSNFKFYMWGKQPNNSVVTAGPSEVTFTQTTGDTTNSKGTVSIDFAPANYNLTLVAVPATTSFLASDGENEYLQKATYVGYANADLRNSDSIKFFISADGLTGGGTLDLTLKPEGTWDSKVLATGGGLLSGYRMYVEIRNRQTEAVIATSDGSGAALSLSGTFDSSTGSSLKTGTNQTISAGTYDFVVCIEDSTVNPKKVYSWSDEIIILPNQSLKANVNIPFFVDVKPDAPDYLLASYYTFDSTNTEEYGIQFNFGYSSSTTKNSGLTQSYELQITDVGTYTGTGSLLPKTGTTPTSDNDWAGISSSNIKTYKKDIYGDSDNGWIAGTLSKSAGGVIIKATLGHEYWARIRAVNNAGESAYTYFTIYSGATGEVNTFMEYSVGGSGKTYTGKKFLAYTLTTAESEAGGVITPAAFATSSVVPTTINLNRVKYNLNGGSLSGNWDGNSTPVTSKEIVQYTSLIDGGAIPILSPTGDAESISTNGKKGETTNPKLVNGTKNWYCWKQNSASGDNYGTLVGHTATPYYYIYPSSKKELLTSTLVLFASYASQAEVEIYNHQNYDFVDKEISASGSGISSIVSGTSGVVAIGDTVTCSSTSGISFTYAPAASHTSDFTGYQSMKIKIVSNIGNKVEFEDSFTNNSVSINSNLPTGTYTVHIIGIYNNNEYEYQFVLKND